MKSSGKLWRDQFCAFLSQFDFYQKDDTFGSCVCCKVKLNWGRNWGNSSNRRESMLGEKLGQKLGQKLEKIGSVIGARIDARMEA